MSQSAASADGRIGAAAGHAFISYVREDSEHVDALQQILENAGIPVWRDTEHLWPGQDWRAQIRAAIAGDALAFLACFSRTSVARLQSYQNEELNEAIEQLRRRPHDATWLIPVRFDDCQIPDQDIGGGRTLQYLQCTDLFGNDYHRNAERLVRVIRQILGNAAVPDINSQRPALPAAVTSDHAFQISTAYWRQYLQTDIGDRLLANDMSVLSDKSPLFELNQLAIRAFAIVDQSVSVKVESYPIEFRVFSPDDLWAATLADLALLGRVPGNMKWLLKKTITPDGQRTNFGRIEAVWDCIERNFLSRGSGVDRRELFRRLVDASLKTSRRDQQKGQLRFLVHLAGGDGELKATFRIVLEDFIQMHADLPPHRISDYLYLIGDLSDDLPRSIPDLVTIRPTGNWPYEFEAMRRPLTVGDAQTLSQILVGDRINLLMPFRFQRRGIFASHKDFYESLSRELMTIVRLIPTQVDKDRGLQWDVPTFPEWLRLSGCDRQRFPWGESFEPNRANLWIEGQVPRIRPVGSFRTGRSPHGVEDCCGNIYELVRVGQGDDVPHAFGLAGQCFRTPPAAADCQHLGRFKPRKSDPRWNIGIRLIRYRGSDEFYRRWVI